LTIYTTEKNNAMKKTGFVFVLLCIASFSFAQVQRKISKTNSVDTVAEKTEAAGVSKKQMMRELNLSKEQKAKLKAVKQSGKDKKAAIENDNTLTAAEKENKLKMLHKEQAKNTMTVLNEEQKAKLVKMRKEKKSKNTDDMEIE